MLPISYLTPATRPARRQLANEKKIAALLQRGGVPCAYRARVRAPQADVLTFDLCDPYAGKKLDRAVAAISGVFGAPILSETVPGGFSLLVPAEREGVNLADALGRADLAPDGLFADLGVSITGRAVGIRIDRAPHVLIAGSTGSGKSVALNTLISSLALRYTSQELRLSMIDPKRVELAQFSALPHMARPTATTTADAAELLRDALGAIEERYKLMQARGVRDSDALRLPRHVIVIDELADLILQDRQAVEPLIVRIAQIGRAAGYHLIVATQRPSADVLTGLISANIPCRVALKVTKYTESVVILGKAGAEKLLGRGDALVRLPDSVTPVRVQCAYTPDADIYKIVRAAR